MFRMISINLNLPLVILFVVSTGVVTNRCLDLEVERDGEDNCIGLVTLCNSIQLA